MTPNLDNYLVDKYPLIFRDRYRSMSETAMCWGFSCADGWFDLIDVLCELSTRYLETRPELTKEFYAVQVKEKFGTLRFYESVGTDYLFTLSEAAEEISEYVCEECGAPGTLCRPNGRRVQCCCPDHGGPPLRPLAPPSVRVAIEQWGDEYVDLHPGPHADAQALANLERYLDRRPEIRSLIPVFARAYEAFPGVAWLLQAILQILGMTGTLKDHPDFGLEIRDENGDPVFELLGTINDEIKAIFDFFSAFLKRWREKNL